jgi:hypothetical protein
LEEMPEEIIWQIVKTLPPEWFGHDTVAMEDLVIRLIRRRCRIRELTTSFRRSGRDHFPNWNSS